MQDLFGGAPIRVPTHVLVKPGSMNKESVVTERLSSLLYVWGTGVTLDEARLAATSLSVTTLFSSSAKSWTLAPEKRPFSFAPPPDGFEQHPLAVLVRGRFRDAFEAKERPAWPMKLDDMMRDGRPRPAPPDPPAGELRPAEGQLLLLGCSRMWQSGFAEALGDAAFLLNALDALTLDEDLLTVRSKQASDRRFDKPERVAEMFWTALPLGVVPLLIVGVGLAVGVIRMRRREAWESEHGR
jgi:hypothetical protein